MNKNRGFISYRNVSQDKKLLAKLANGLKAHLRDSKTIDFESWQDNLIEIGEEWHIAIQNAIDECDFAILLISAEYMDSDYIREHEFDVFLKASETRDFKIFPILIRDYDFGKVAKLKKYQFFKPASEDYGFPKEGTELLPYNKLFRIDTDGVYNELPHLDKYHKNLAKQIEISLSKKQINDIHVLQNKQTETTMYSQNLTEFIKFLQNLVDDVAKHPQYFEEIDKCNYDYNKAQYSQLKNEYLDGAKGTEFRGRMKTFAGTLKKK
jgi:hypothetical protein